jgi:hypothetical protein
LLGLQGVLEQVVFVIQDERSAITGQVAFECDFFHSLEEVFVNDLYILYVSAYILQLCWWFHSNIPELPLPSLTWQTGMEVGVLSDLQEELRNVLLRFCDSPPAAAPAMLPGGGSDIHSTCAL